MDMIHFPKRPIRTKYNRNIRPPIGSFVTARIQIDSEVNDPGT